MDTASALALIQEEELSRSRGKWLNKDAYKSGFRGHNDKNKWTETEKSKSKDF